MPVSKLLRVTAMMVLAVALLWAGGNIISTTASPADDTLVVVQGADPVSLDPTMHREVPTYNVTMNIFDSLLFKAADGTIEPALAESWERLDETTYRFHLRKGVTFHNGEPFNAEAVRFTIARILDPDQQSKRRSGFAFIKDVRVLGDYTIEITTEKPYPLAQVLFAELQIVPPKYMQEVGDAGFNDHPVGTGPYKFVSTKSGTYVKLEANADYWRGAPSSKKLRFDTVPEAVSRMAGLISGQSDIVTGLSPTLIPQVQASPGVSVKTVAGSRVIYVGFNTLTDGPLQDVRVRQAINYAVNKEAIIKSILNGMGKVTTTLLTEQDFGYTDTVDPYPYNPQKARELLAAAGYPDGFEIVFDTPNGRYMNDKQVAQAIAGQLAQVGIKAKLEVREFGSYMGDVFGGTASPMFFLGWGNPVFDADYILYQLVRTDQLIAYFSDPEIDKYLDIAGTTTDRAKRKAAYAKALPLINEEAPMLFLYKQKDAYGVRDSVDWAPRADEFLWMYSAH